MSKKSQHQIDPHLVEQTKDMSLNAAIRFARRRRGWTQKELAQDVGVSQVTISAYERGRWRPAARNIPKLAAALRLPIDRFM